MLKLYLSQQVLFFGLAIQMIHGENKLMQMQTTHYGPSE